MPGRSAVPGVLSRQGQAARAVADRSAEAHAEIPSDDAAELTRANTTTRVATAPDRPARAAEANTAAGSNGHVLRGGERARAHRAVWPATANALTVASTAIL